MQGLSNEELALADLNKLKKDYIDLTNNQMKQVNLQIEREAFQEQYNEIIKGARSSEIALISMISKIDNQMQGMREARGMEDLPNEVKLAMSQIEASVIQVQQKLAKGIIDPDEAVKQISELGRAWEKVAEDNVGFFGQGTSQLDWYATFIDNILNNMGDAFVEYQKYTDPSQDTFTEYILNQITAIDEQINKLTELEDKKTSDTGFKPLVIEPLDMVSTAEKPSLADMILGFDLQKFESTKAEIDAAMLTMKEKLTADMLELREELAGLSVMDTIAGGTSEEREDKKNKIIKDINDINQAIQSVTTQTVASTTESIGFLGKFAKGFKKTVIAIGSDENQVMQDVLDGASSLIAAGGHGKEKQIKMQKAMIKANTAKGLIDIWTSPAPSDPLTAAKAIAASAVLIGKASQSNQQLNQALADLKGGDTDTSTTFAEYGMNQVVDGATPIIAGEAGAELVQITPLEGPNTQGPQGQGQIIITGNVMSKDFVEDELVEQLKESIRQGYDFR